MFFRKKPAVSSSLKALLFCAALSISSVFPFAWAGEFAANDEGSMLYYGEEGGEYCWNCFSSPWTEQARHFLAVYFPSSLRVESPESAFKHYTFNCAGGAAQAGADVAASGALWLAEPAAYIFEPFDPKKTKALLKHRWNQAVYGFYYVMEGELFELIGEKAKLLARHIIRSVREGDAYSLCEMAAVAGMFFIGPKIKTKWAEDAKDIKERQQAGPIGISVQRAEQNRAKALRDLETAQASFRRQKDLSLKLAELDGTIVRKRGLKLETADERTKLALHISSLERRKNEIDDPDGFSAPQIESLNRKIAEAQARRNDLDKQASGIEESLNKALTERQALGEELRAMGIGEAELRARAAFSSAMLEKGERRLSRALQREEAARNKEAVSARARRLLIQTAKTPKYTASAIFEWGRETLPTSWGKAFALPFVTAGEGVTIFAFYGAGRFLHEPDEENLEDWLNALSAQIDSP